MRKPSGSMAKCKIPKKTNFAGPWDDKKPAAPDHPQEKEDIMRKINGFLIAGIIGISVFGAHFGIQYGRAVWGNNDMWWTPKSMALPLSKSQHNFELFVNGDLLQDHLDRNSLSATDLQGERYELGPEDIKVRLNNWHKVKSTMLHTAVWAAFMLGISLMSLIVGVKQFISGNKTSANKSDAGDAQQRA